MLFGILAHLQSYFSCLSSSGLWADCNLYQPWNQNRMTLAPYGVGLLYLNGLSTFFFFFFCVSNLWNGTPEELFHLPWVSWVVYVAPREEFTFLKISTQVCPEAAWLNAIWMGKCFSTPGCTCKAARAILEGSFISSFNMRCLFPQWIVTLRINH